VTQQEVFSYLNGTEDQAAGERAFGEAMETHADRIIAAVFCSAGFMATEEPARTTLLDPGSWQVTPMRKVPAGLAEKRRDWVAGRCTLDEWIGAVNAATLADLDGLPPAPWLLPWWKRVCVRVLTLLAGHPR
jgi:hypothetical protein